MKIILLILSILLIPMFGCKTKSINYHISKKYEFDYFTTDEEFTIILREFYKNNAKCGGEALPYSLLIGITVSEELPDKISVLSLCDNRIFKQGDILMIKPVDNPTEKTSMNPIYLVKDTLINEKKLRWLIGSEYKAIWGLPNRIELKPVKAKR